MTPDTVNHFTRMLLTTPALQGLPRIGAIQFAIFRQCEELEAVFAAIIATRNLDTADWARLLLLAKVVGQPVITSDVETLRRLVKARIAVNGSSGRRNDLIQVLDILLGEVTVKAWSTYDGGYEVVVRSDDANVDSYVFDMLEEASASGIHVRLLHAPTDGGFSFGDGVRGWDDVPPSDTTLAD